MTEFCAIFIITTSETWLYNLPFKKWPVSPTYLSPEVIDVLVKQALLIKDDLSKAWAFQACLMVYVGFSLNWKCLFFLFFLFFFVVFFFVFLFCFLGVGGWGGGGGGGGDFNSPTKYNNIQETYQTNSLRITWKPGLHQKKSLNNESFHASQGLKGPFSLDDD